MFSEAADCYGEIKSSVHLWDTNPLLIGVNFTEIISL